jgi:hypothetical protein
MSVWTREQFPVIDLDLSYSDRHWPGYRRSLGGTSDNWNAKQRKPYCWTPSKGFCFGNQQFIALYPCIAFETRNFGHVIQRRWDRMVSGME